MIRALIVVLIAMSVGTQQPQRDMPTAAATRVGSASVAGLVTLGDEAQTPVRRAVITVASSDGLQTASAITDDEGRFVISALRAGRYTLQALKPAHLTTTYGARRPGRPGTVLVVNDGQALRDLRVMLPRGAVLAGRVTLENGEPLPNTQVMAIPMRLSTAGGVAIAPPREFQTDDRGEFRIFGLMPDTYVIAALPAFGRGEIQRRSDQEFDAVVRSLQRPATAAPGQTATSPTETPAASSAPIVGYAPTYFPGTPIVNDAMPLTVKAGEVRDGLGFTVAPVPMATISGTLIGANGAPAQAIAMSVELVGPPLPAIGTLAPKVIRPNARGEFTIANLGPGLYRIRVRAGGVTLRPDGTTAEIRAEAQTQWAMAEVAVTGANIEGLTLALQPGHVFTGTVTTDAAAAPASWKGTMVTVHPATAAVASRQFPVGDDGRFTITGIEPHNYEVRVTLPAALAGSGWALGSIRHQGRDLRDAPLTFTDGSIEGAEVLLTQSVTALTGTLTLESGAAATEYFIVAFPDDRALWHPASPRVRIMRPAADGAFSTRDLPPGTYRIAALVDVEDDEPRRREFLESIYDAALRVTVEAAKTARQDIRIK